MTDAEISEALRRMGALHSEVVIDILMAFARALDRRGTLPKSELVAVLAEELAAPTAEGDKLVTRAIYARMIGNLTPPTAKPPPRWVPGVIDGGKFGAENGAEIGPENSSKALE